MEWFIRFCFVLLLLFQLLEYCHGVDAFFRNSQAVKHGQVYPFEIKIQAGHDVIAGMLNTLVNQERCVLRTPDFIDVDLADNQDERFQKWGTGGCVVKINNITRSDHGRWQLLSLRDNRSLQGIFSIIIEDASSLYQDNTFEYVDGDVVPNIDFIKSESQYCVITHERIGDMVVKGDCIYPVQTIDRRLMGKWTLGVGMPGSIEEIILEKEVVVRAEDLDIGFDEDLSNSLVYVYCNLKNSMKRIDFCRFERVTDKQAFNLNDGLGKGKYSYYGRGMYMNDCGMTILNPTSIDYGSWRCMVGVTTNEHDVSSVMRGAMLVTSSASRLIHRNAEQKVILSVKGRPLVVTCSTAVSIIYCSVMHPNGTIIAPNKNDQTYRFETENYNIGQCDLIINEGNVTDSGDYTCYMGAKQVGLEITEIVTVRVGGGLVATDSEIQAYKGDNVTIRCATAGGFEELKHCRFITPTNLAFNIDETITEDNPIIGEYFYPSDSHIFAGDCAVTIIEMKSHHFGEWRCSGMIKTEDIEYMDTITLVELFVPNPLSTASVTGIVFGVGLMLVTVVGLIMWKKQALPRCLRRDAPPPEVEDIHQARFSGESGDSVMELNVRPSGQPTYGVAHSSNI